MSLAYIPSPTRSAVFLGPLPLRFYALAIILGIVVAVWLGARRWVARGGKSEDVYDVAGWAVVFGIIGGRLYHLATDPELYFLGRPGTHPIDAFKIWDGGLGIWGAIAFGFLGAWIGCRRHGMRISSFADVVIPGIAFAQGIGRLGNYFNNELYGGPTSLPWKLQVHTMDLQTGRAGAVIPGFYHPTFLYELIWDVALGFVLLWADRRFRFGHGRLMALYVMGYTVGRVWIEHLRIDTANHFLGLRVNEWTSIVLFLAGLAWFLTHRGREASIYLPRRAAQVAAAAADGDSDVDSAVDGDANRAADGDGNRAATAAPGAGDAGRDDHEPAAESAVEPAGSAEAVKGSETNR